MSSNLEIWEFVIDGQEEIQILDYLGNTANAKGSFTEFNPPKIIKSFDTSLRLGERGTIPRPMRIEEMSSDMALKGISTEFCKMVSIAFGDERKIGLTLTGLARSRYSSVTADMSVTIKGHPKKIPVTPMFKPNEVSEMEMEIAVVYYSELLSNFSLIIDLETNKFEVNGVNLWN